MVFVMCCTGCRVFCRQVVYATEHGSLWLERNKLLLSYTALHYISGYQHRLLFQLF